MKKVAVYVHGKGGSAAEAEHYVLLLPDYDVVGFDYRAENPWQAKEEFLPYFDELARGYEDVLLIADSLGAFLSMSTCRSGRSAARDSFRPWWIWKRSSAG